MSEIEIVSDGTAQGSFVRLRDGTRLSCVISVEIEPISFGKNVRAKITVDRVALQMQIQRADIQCTDLLTADSLREAIATWKLPGES